MSIADEVQALELERDTLQAALAATSSALAAMRERGSTGNDFWRARAERAEARVALLEAYASVEAYAKKPPDDVGEWHVAFSYDGAAPAGLGFDGAYLPMTLSGLITSWFEDPKEMEITISKPVAVS